MNRPDGKPPVEVPATAGDDPVPEPPPPVDPNAWRGFVADLPADWWNRWRNRTTELLFALRRYPEVEDIKSAEFKSYEEIRPLYEAQLREKPAGPAWPPRDPRLAGWSDPWRLAWGLRSNALIDSGLDWRAAELTAFQEVLARRLAAGLPEHGTPREPGPDDPRAPRRPDDQSRLPLAHTP